MTILLFTPAATSVYVHFAVKRAKMNKPLMALRTSVPSWNTDSKKFTKTKTVLHMPKHLQSLRSLALTNTSGH